MIGRTNASGGGGLDTDELTAVAGDVLKGKTAGVKGSDDPVTGTLELTGNAADANVLTGKTYYNTDAKTKRSGTMANNGAMSGSLNCGQSKSIPAGYTTGGTVTANSLASQTSATAAASHILSGQTAWVNGNRITGNMANRGAYGGVGNSRGNDAGNKRMWVRVPGGYYNENANVYLNWSDIASMAGLTADKIKKGVSIMNVLGSFQGMVDSPYYLFKTPGTGSSANTVSPFMYFPSTVVKTTRGYEEDDWTKNSTKLWFKLGNENSAGAYRLLRWSSAAISLSAYKTLYLNVSSTAYGNGATYQRFGLSTSGSITGNSFNAYIDIAGAINNGTYSLDISALNGTYWFYLWQQLPGTGSRGTSGSLLNFYNIYLIG